MERRLLLANWKMNLDLGESIELIESYKRVGLPELLNNCSLDFAIAASCPILKTIKDYSGGTPFHIFSQDCSRYDGYGAYTGEVSAKMQKSVGVDGVILGHSERRELLGETYNIVNTKASNVVTNEMKVCLCVGESEEEKDDGRSLEIIREQLHTGLKNFSPIDLVESLIIAYEPIWAISTSESNKSPDPQEMKKVLDFIREVIADKFGSEVQHKTNIIYGGSVNPDNIGAYIEMENFDGAIVGSASLNAESILKIAETISTVC